MDIQQVISDTKYNIRTQISLSASLYHLLQERAKKEEKSLAAVVRERVIRQLKNEEEKEQQSQERIRDIIKAVDALKGKSGWSHVKNPHALIRRWRQDDDKKREEMMKKALR